MNFATGEYGNYLLIDMVKDLYEWGNGLAFFQ